MKNADSRTVFISYNERDPVARREFERQQKRIGEHSNPVEEIRETASHGCERIRHLLRPIPV